MTLTQIKHRMRWLQQRVRKPSIAVVGGYHGGNLGDMALGLTCKEILARCGVRSGLQTIYSLEKWPASPLAVVGGGAVGYRACLEQLVARYGEAPKRVAILGVDFNDEEALFDYRGFLRGVSRISCRSETQAAAVSALLGRDDVLHHPDLVFAYPRGGPANGNSSYREKILGVNCTTFFWTKSGGQYAPGTDWETEVRRRAAHLLPAIKVLGPKYVSAFSAVMQRAREEGWRIWHLPFSPEDDRFAQRFFADLVDEYWPYSPSPKRMLALIGRCGRMLPTRFHSLVMALMTGTPVVPFCYAEKSQHVFESIGMSEVRQITAADLLADDKALLAGWGQPVIVPEATLRQALQTVQTTIEATIRLISGTPPAPPCC